MRAGSVIATTTTNAQGNYSFNGLAPGSYSVKFITPDGSAFTTEGVGANTAINSDVAPSTGVLPSFTLTSGENLTTVDAGLLPVDLSVTKTVNNATPALNGNVTFTITVSNATGYSQATGVSLTDILPAGLSFVSASATEGSYNSANGSWSIGTVASGSSAVLTMVATVTTAGTKTNVATVAGTDEDDIATAAQLTSNASVTPVVPADLQVMKTVSNATPNVGSNVTFTITLTDLGPGGASGVTASDALPAGLTYVSSNATQGTYNAATGVWTVGAVTYGAAAPTLTMVANVATAGVKANTVTITSSSVPDPNPANNTSTVTVTPVTPSDDLIVTKSVDNALPTVGTEVNFYITVGNTGPNISTNTIATDLLPAGLTFVSYVASQGTYNPTTGVWSIGSVGVNTTPVTMTVTALVTSLGLKTNTVTVSSDELDTDPSTDTASALVIPQAPTTPPNVIPNPPPTPDPSKYYYLGR